MSLPAMKPRRGNIAVAPIFERDTYESDIIDLIKPDQWKGRSTQGIVKYLGEGIPDDIQKGDYVFFSAYTGTLWSIGDELLIIMGQSKIIGKRDISEDDRQVPGLYFKGVTDWDDTRLRIRDHLLLIKQIDFRTDESYARQVIDNIIKSTQPQYWPADYAQSIKLIAASIDDALTLVERDPQNQENFLTEEDE